jgi:filamentous hemagglutinin family protein
MLMRKPSIFLYIFIFLLYSAQVLFALPELQDIESGSVVFDSSNQSTLNITADDKAVINFKSFSIGQNEAVNFFQPSASSTLLSRVTGNEASQIFGTLTANGILFLINPNGINFGLTANVQVNTLIASTLDVSTNNFLSGNYILEHGENSYAAISNAGTITGNNVALVASAVNNTGVIRATAGTVHLASGDKTTITLDKRGLIQMEINEATSGKVYDSSGVTIKDALANSGTIEAAQVYMTANTAADIFENAVNQKGIVKANKLTEEDGIIRIVSNNNIEVSGTVEAEGDIHIFADADKNGVGELHQTAGEIFAKATGNVYLDGSGTMELSTIKTENGAIKIGTRAPPAAITGSPHFIHTAGDFEINQVTTDGAVTILQTSRGDVLRYNPLGNLTLEATNGRITDLTNTALTADYLKLIANGFIINSASLTTHLYKNSGDLFIANASSVGDLVTLEGDDLGTATYLKTNKLTLQSDGAVNTNPGIIIQAAEVKVIAQKFGSIEVPLNIDSPLTYIYRTNGNIDILESTGIGTSILLRGPPDGFGAIIYSSDTHLILEAQAGSINSLSTDAIITVQNLSLIAQNNIGTADLPLYFTSSTLTNFISRNGSIHIDSNNTDIYIRGNIEAYGDINVYSHEGVIDLRGENAQIASETGSINLETTTGHINVYGIISAPEGTVRLWTSTSIDLGGAKVISKAGGYIWNPLDKTSVHWDGGTDTNWNTAANWSGGVVPNTSDFDVTIDANVTVTMDIAAGVTIGDLTLGGTNTANLTLAGNLTVASDGQPSGTTGSLTITKGTLSLSTFDLNVAGNVSIASGGAVTKGSGTWTFNGSSTQSYKDSTSGIQDIGKTVIANNVTVDATGNGMKVNTLTINSSKTLDITNTSLYITGTGSGVNAPFSNSGTLTTTGSTVIYYNSSTAVNTDITPVAYNNLTIDSTNNTGYMFIADMTGANEITGTLTVKYVWLNVQNHAFTVGNLVTTIVGEGIYSPSSTCAITIKGNLTNGGSFHAAGATSTIKIGGNFTNSGIFTPGSATVVFTGASASITISAGSTTFDNLTYDPASADPAPADPASGTLTINSSTTVDGNITITNGTISVPTGITLTQRINHDAQHTLTLSVASSALSGAGTYECRVRDVNQSLSLTNNGKINIQDFLYNYRIIYDAVSSLSGTIPATNYGVTTATNLTLQAENVSCSETLHQVTLSFDGNPLTIKGNLVFQNLNTSSEDAPSLTVSNSKNSAISIGGNFTINSPCIYTKGPGPTTETITFNGTAAQTFTTQGQTFNNITISNTSANVTQSGNITINGTLQIDANATYDVDGNNITVTTFNNNGKIIFQGGESTVSIPTMDTNSGEVQYDGASSYTQLIAGDSYYDLSFNNASGTWTLDATLDVNNDLTITAGTLNANGYSINIGGDWSRSGTFNHGNNTVTFDGSAAQIITGATTWYNLTIANTYATPDNDNDVDPSSVQTVTNLLSINDGQWTPYTGDDYAGVTIGASGIMKPDASASITVSGNWTNNGTFTANSSTVTFDGTGTKTINTGGTSFATVTFNGSGSTWTLDTNNLAATTMNVTAGTLNVGTGKTITVSGTLTINGGTITGTAYNVNITANAINHTSGTISTTTSGNIYLNGAGSFSLYILSPAAGGSIYIGNTTPPSDITFAGIFTVSSGGEIEISSTGDITIRYSIASSASGGNITINTQGNFLTTGGRTAIQSNGSGDIAITVSGNATLGNASGYGDIYSTNGDIAIDAGGDVAVDYYTWVGANGSGNISITADGSITLTTRVTNQESWIYSTTGNVTCSAGNNITVNERNYTYDEGGITSESGGTVTLEAANNITLGYVVTTNNITLTADSDSSGAGQIIDVNGSGSNVSANVLTLSAATGIDTDTTVNSITAHQTGTGDIDITETDAVTLTDIDTNNGNIAITAGGAITATDVVSVGGGITLTSEGTSTLQAVTSAGNLTLSKTTSAAVYNVASSATITVTGNLSINTGVTLSMGNNSNLNLAGNWTNSGIFTAGNSTVTFTNSTTISGSSTNTFNNVTISGTLTGPSSANMNVAGDWTNNGTFTHNSGTVTFTGAGKSISGSSNSNFYNLTINSAGTITVSSKQTFTGNLNITGNLSVNSGITLKQTITNNATASLTINDASQLSGSGIYLVYQLNASNSLILPIGSGAINIADFQYRIETVGVPQSTTVLAGTYGGNLTLTGNTSFSDTCLITFNLGGNINVGGNLTLYSYAISALEPTVKLSPGANNISVTGNFDIGNNADTTGVIDVRRYNFTGGAGTVSVTGNLRIQQGTGENTIFTAGSGQVTVNGQYIVNGSPTVDWTTNSGTLYMQTNTNQTSFPNNTYYNLELDDNGGGATAYTWSGAMTIQGNFTIDAGVTIINNSKTFTFSGTATPVTWTDSTSGQDLGAVTIGDGTNAKTVNLGSSVKATSVSIAANGILVDATYTITITGTGASVWVKSGIYNATGTVNFTGASPQIGASNFNHLTITVSGTATLTGNITVAGNLNVASGTLDTNNKTVTFDGSGASTISGSTTFYNLACSTAGKTLTFTRGTTQTVTHDLTLTGITINDTGSGAVPILTLQAGATQNITDVHVTNNIAGGLTLVANGASTITGTTNWILGTIGETFTWTGAVDTNWNNPLNWDLSSVPSSTNKVIIPVTANQPVLSGSATIKGLTLNGTLNLSSAMLTVDGNITSASGGTITGVSPTLNVSGYIGTKDHPINISVSGTLTMQAGSMQDNVSISVTGAGNYSVSGSLPGFVIINGKIESDVGQQSIRSTLIQGESIAYREVLMPQPMMMPAFIMPMPAITPIAAPVPAAIPAVPMFMPIAPIPAAPILAPPAPTSLPAAPITPPAPVKPAFEGVVSGAALPKTINFSGSSGNAFIPRSISQAFTNVTSQSLLSGPIVKSYFGGAIARLLLPEYAVSKSSFAGAFAGTNLPEVFTLKDFRGVVPSATGLSKAMPRISFAGALSDSILSTPISMRELSQAIVSARLPHFVSLETFSDVSSYALLPEAFSRRAFEGSIANYVLPRPLTHNDFMGVFSQSVLPQPVLKTSFDGITSNAVFPKMPPARPLFEGAVTAANLPKAFSLRDFSSAVPSVYLHLSVIKDDFRGIASRAMLPEPPPKAPFEGIRPAEFIPERISPIIFKDVESGGMVKVMFPGGLKIIPTYGMLGVPLGSEKPLLDPNIQKEEENK